MQSSTSESSNHICVPLPPAGHLHPAKSMPTCCLVECTCLEKRNKEAPLFFGNHPHRRCGFMFLMHY
eukprot:5790928-Amphidinium_carterae.1